MCVCLGDATKETWGKAFKKKDNKDYKMLRAYSELVLNNWSKSSVISCSVFPSLHWDCDVFTMVKDRLWIFASFTTFDRFRCYGFRKTWFVSYLHLWFWNFPLNEIDNRIDNYGTLCCLLKIERKRRERERDTDNKGLSIYC